MVHSRNVVLSASLIHSLYMVLSDTLIHSLWLALSRLVIHSKAMVLSGSVIHSRILALSAVMIHSTHLVLSKAVIHSHILGSLNPLDLSCPSRNKVRVTQNRNRIRQRWFFSGCVFVRLAVPMAQEQFDRVPFSASVDMSR